MVTWLPGFFKPCHMGQQFCQESWMDSTDRRHNKKKVPTQFWPGSLKNTGNFGDHGSKWEDYIKMYLNWISTLADKQTNNGLKQYEHFKKNIYTKSKRFCIEKQKENAQRNTGINFRTKGWEICHAEERMQEEIQQEEV